METTIILVEGNISTSIVENAEQVCRSQLGQKKVKLVQGTPGLSMNVGDAAALISAVAAVAALAYTVWQDRLRRIEEFKWTAENIKALLDAKFLKMDAASHEVVSIENHNSLNDQSNHSCIIQIKVNNATHMSLSVSLTSGHATVRIETLPKEQVPGFDYGKK